MTFKIIIHILLHALILVHFSSIAVAQMKADSHAPIGVMGDHMHKKGKFMTSYRYMYMDMGDLQNDGSNITADTIATSVSNRFSRINGQPPTLRVVPKKMDMHMHMFGAMYAPTDWLTLMVMSNYTDKKMKLTTYKGGSGTTARDTFTTQSNGWGDTKLTGLIHLFSTGNHKVHLSIGTVLPTGSTSETDQILTPMGMRPTKRLPYAMQLGNGNYGILNGLTYSGRHQKLTWGGQYSGTEFLGKHNGYRKGQQHEVTAWTSFAPADTLSISTRLKYRHDSKIKGIDPLITLPTQAANPDYYGGDVVAMLLGLNWVCQSGYFSGVRIGLEAELPLMQELNGVRLEQNFNLMAGLQYAF
jgi:hypothetical protein